VLKFHEKAQRAIEAGATISDVISLPSREKIGRAKYVPEDEIQRAFIGIEESLDGEIAKLTSLDE